MRNGGEEGKGGLPFSAETDGKRRIDEALQQNAHEKATKLDATMSGRWRLLRLAQSNGE